MGVCVGVCVCVCWGGGGGGRVLDRSKIPWYLSFFLLFLAQAATLLSRAGQLEQFWYRITQGTFL